MLQRLQSLYLLLAVIALTLMMFFNFCTYEVIQKGEPTGSVFEVSMFGVEYSSEDGKEVEKINEVLGSMISDRAVGMLFDYGFIGVLLLIGGLIYMIFRYKNRARQLKFGRFMFLILLIVFVGLIFGATEGLSILESNLRMVIEGKGIEFEVGYSVGVFMPIIAAAFVFLANIRIKKDEQLVRSIDRLR